MIKNIVRMSRLLLALVVLAIIAYSLYSSETVQKKYFYPYPYRGMIENAANADGIDPLLLVSVMKAESGFDCNAVSSVGAMGLMQLMPDTAEWVAKQAGVGFNGEGDLFSPDKSIVLGSWYLASLLEERKGNKVLALAAYNAGRGNVDHWMTKYKWAADFSSIDEIPFTETREFVKRVLVNYEKYKKIYRNGK